MMRSIYIYLLKIRMLSKRVVIEGLPEIEDNVDINAKDGIIILKNNSRVWKGSILDSAGGGKIVIESESRIGNYCVLKTFGGKIIFGKRSLINQFSTIYGHGDVEIGKDVLIGPNVVFASANHEFTKGTKIKDQPEEKKKIKIGDDVWIGSGARILGGVKLGNGCVVAVGSVVTKNFTQNSIVAGIPAKLVKKRK